MPGASKATTPGRCSATVVEASILIEFAGNSGVGKTSTAARAYEILAHEGVGVPCAPAPRLSASTVAMQIVAHPQLFIPIRHLRRLSVSVEGPIVDWATRVATTALALRTARRASTLVIAPEIMFHWLKKLPLSVQPKLLVSGVPLPDLIVHLVSTPAERLRRQISRGRPSNSISRAPATELESLASRTADDLLAAFPLDSATALMLRWGEGRAGRRIPPAQLLALLNDAAKRSQGVNPALHRLKSGGHIQRSADALRIPRVTVATQASTTLDEVASDAARAILDYTKGVEPHYSA